MGPAQNTKSLHEHGYGLKDTWQALKGTHVHSTGLRNKRLRAYLLVDYAFITQNLAISRNASKTTHGRKNNIYAESRRNLTQTRG